MRLRILGCHGGESPSHRATSFLIDDHLLLDAGSLTRSLTVPEQARVDHIFLSHSHLDHIRDLALLADNVIGLRNKPVTIHCTAPVAQALETHLFNDIIWPDFTKIPNPADLPNPVLRICRMQSGEHVQVPGYSVSSVPVNHPVDCHALFVRGPAGTLVYSGDTGPTEKLWDAINALTDLRAFIYEVSFPNAMEKLAQVSGHLTPTMLASELRKYKPHTEVPVLLYHLKPGFFELLRCQVESLHDKRLRVLEPKEEYVFD